MPGRDDPEVSSMCHAPLDVCWDAFVRDLALDRNTT